MHIMHDQLYNSLVRFIPFQHHSFRLFDINLNLIFLNLSFGKGRQKNEDYNFAVIFAAECQPESEKILP